MNVTVLTTGGTIASTAGEGGATPTKRGEELVEAVPELAEEADVTVESAAQVPSYQMDAETLESIGEQVATLEDDVEAVVVTHGTDTMAETAYYLDVARRPDLPVFVTGAQRRPDEVSPDGPANLLTAVRAAKAVHDRDASGVFVAFDETIHAARWVRKLHTSRLGAFESPDAGPVATVDRDAVVFRRQPRSETEPVPATSLEATVYAVRSGSCVPGDMLEAALERGADGIVLEGTGLGNATVGLGEAVRDTLEGGVPVVVTSRCPGGRVVPVYGGPGGGSTLRDHGAVFAGDLSTGKARLRLMLALAAGDGTAAVRDAFAHLEAQPEEPRGG
ncbi:asparaginase [Halopiger goleimassiliensis]|uniref:asparaginase n=1 Tax=Halopiger goleimassiliensis TaxID=1293048 RepID=UPI0006782078|nr:asparaginase [Halopiger goleimassiliensis]